MDLTKLKWTKNVNHKDIEWAYQNIDLDSKVFELHWKPDNTENAQRPKEGELIIVRQRTRVTHIVELLNNTLYPAKTENCWIYRLVRAVWMAEFWSEPPKQDDVFGNSLNLQGGKVMEIENLSAFKERWSNKGGLSTFQEHVSKELKLK